MTTETYVPPANGFRTFLIVWVTQSISVFGSALTFFALNIWMITELYPLPEQKPELAAAIALNSLAFAIPTVFLAPIAGAYVDRHDRKRTMLGMDFANGILTILLMVMVASGSLQLWSLILFSLATATVGVFHGAAFDTSYAMLVPEAQLPRANGMMQTIWSLSGIISPAIAAGIISLPGMARQGLIGGPIGDFLSTVRSGGALAMGVDSVTFFIAAFTLIFLFIPSPKRADMDATGKPQKSIWADVKQGGLYIWHRRPMLWLLGTFAFANFTAGPLGVFEPLMVKFNFADSWTASGFTIESAMASLATAVSVGGVVGGVLISTWGGFKKRRVYGVIGALLVESILIAVVGLSNNFFLAVGLLAFGQGMIPIANAHSQSIWQSITPHELQGRVFSVRRVIAQFSWPLSTALAGLLGGLFNPGIVLTVMNVVLAMFLVFQFFNPSLLRVEDKAYLEELADKASAKQPVVQN